MARPTWSRKWSACTGSTTSPAWRCRAPTASPGRPPRRSSSSSAGCAARPRARGLNEAVTWSFVPPADADHFAEGNGGLWVLENPISEDMKAMRPSLLPGLLAAAKRNLDRGASGVRLFEIGRRYLRGDSGRATSGRRWPCCWPARRSRAAGRAARRKRSTPSTPRPRRWRCSPKPGRRSTSCRSWGKRDRSSIPASRPRCGSGPRPCSRASACCTRKTLRGVRRRCPSGGGRAVPRRDPGEEGRVRPRRLCAARRCRR